MSREFIGDAVAAICVFAFPFILNFIAHGLGH